MRYAPGRFDLSDVQSTPAPKPVRAFTCAPAVAGAELCELAKHYNIDVREQLMHAWKGGPR